MTKGTAERYSNIDIRYCQRNGFLTKGTTGTLTWSSRGKVTSTINFTAHDSMMVLSYKTRSNGGDWVDQKYPVHIVRTACNYGGTRAWFLCPAMGCHKRVAVLYGGSVFACRTCHNLNYRSQQESKLEQPCTQADKIRERLGWQAGILNGSGTKPKGMHQTTYRRLVYRHDVLMGRAIGAIRGRFKF